VAQVDSCSAAVFATGHDPGFASQAAPGRLRLGRIHPTRKMAASMELQALGATGRTPFSLLVRGARLEAMRNRGEGVGNTGI
jgi:hypothetical protein